MSRKHPTIQDVAQRAQVSTATVSRALSAPDSVSEAKREAVREAIRVTGYRVNRAARSLRTQRSNTVLALLPALGNPFFSQVLQGIENVLTPVGQALVVAETQQIQAAGEDLGTYLEDRRADGVIVLDGQLPQEWVDDVQGSPNAHRVIFACEWLPDGIFPSVRSANVDGAMRAVHHLHDLGHQSLAHLTGPKGNVLTIDRMRGFEAACGEFGLNPHLIEGDFTLESGAAAADEILRLTPRPTAVFCASDTSAFGLISALTKRGVRVPHDMSVIGFDDIELSEHFVPALTSIRQDRIALGAQAARLLLGHLHGGSDADPIEVVPVSLIERDSCAGPTS